MMLASLFNPARPSKKRLRPSVLAVASIVMSLAVIAAIPTYAHARSHGRRSAPPNVYIFGDSISDNGNAKLSFPDYFPAYYFLPPFAGDGFSNGPMWPDYLGEMIGNPILPAAKGGTNYAIGGATISPENYYNVIPAITGFAQVDQFLADHGGVADPKGIYVVWLGNNDIDPPAEFTEWNFEQLEVMIDRLHDAGARQFLVPNLFDIGALPVITTVVGDPVYAQQLTEMTILWNDLLEGLPARYPDSKVRISDSYGLKKMVDEYPRLFGFTNTTQSCLEMLSWTETGDLCSDLEHYWYIDGAHFNTKGERLVASLFALDLLLAGELKISDLISLH